MAVTPTARRRRPACRPPAPRMPRRRRAVRLAADRRAQHALAVRRTRPPTTAASPPTITHLRELELHGRQRATTRAGAPLEVIPTKADYVLDLIRANSLWPLLSGLACCAIEMMSAATSKNDMDRLGMFPFRASPRQADVLIVAGTLTTKMAGPLVRLWEQMPEPKWCVAMGDCTCSGGRYKRSYATSRASTGSCPSTSTCRAARPARRASSTA